MIINSLNSENQYFILDELRPLLELIWDGNKVEVIHGHLHINNKIILPKNYGHIPTALAKLLDTVILTGMGSRVAQTKVDSKLRKQAVIIEWYDFGKGTTVSQFFNNTAKRKVVNRKDTGSSKNGMLYKSFIKITKTIPARASRLPMRRYIERLVTGEIITFGTNGYKLKNSSVENLHISHEHILAYVPHEFVTEKTPHKYLKRTYKAQHLHTASTEPLHSELLLKHSGQAIQPFSNAYANKHIKRLTFKEKSIKGYYNKYTDDMDLSNCSFNNNDNNI